MENQTVKFQGNELAYCWFNDEPYIAIKHICEAIGIGYSSALQTVKDDEILASVMTLCPITAGDKKVYDMQCLPLSYLNGWLFSISTEKVGEQAKFALLAYKRECYRVLFEHFFGRKEAHNRATEVFVALHQERSCLKGLQKQQADSELGQEIALCKKKIRTLEAEQAGLDLEMFGKQLELLSSPTI
jgi:hypothetical protein